jgi:outer membrane PBP1 activator LpoA protein
MAADEGADRTMSIFRMNAFPRRRRSFASAVGVIALSIVLGACSAAAPAAAPAVAPAGAAAASATYDAGSAVAVADGTVADDVLDAPVLIEADYIATVLALLDEIVAATDAIDGVLGRADVESDTWQAELTAALDALVAPQAVVAALDPPDSMTLVQELLEEATGQFATAADALVGGLSVMDLDQIQSGIEELSFGIEALAEARAQLPL